MHQNQRAVGRNGGRVFDQVKLHGGAGKCFDPVQAAGLEQRPLWTRVAESGDVYGEGYAAGTLRVQRQRVQHGACCLRRVAETFARGDIVWGEVFDFSFQSRSGAVRGAQH